MSKTVGYNRSLRARIRRESRAVIAKTPSGVIFKVVPGSNRILGVHNPMTGEFGYDLATMQAYGKRLGRFSGNYRLVAPFEILSDYLAKALGYL